MTQTGGNKIQTSDNAQTDISEIDDNFNSLRSTHAGTSAPSYKVDGTPWWDTNFNPPKLKLYDNDNSTWVEHGRADQWRITDWTVGNVSDASTLVISGDRTETLVEGRMIQVEQPTNGITYAPVDSTSYDSGNDQTTVNIDGLRTQDLDSGEGVDFLYYGQLSNGTDDPLPRIPYEKELDRKTFTIEGPELDMSNTNTVDLLAKGAIDAARGGDSVRVVKIECYVTTSVQADSTTPVVEVQDNSSNNLGLTVNTFADGDAVGVVRLDEVADGDAPTVHDLTSEKIILNCTTSASDDDTDQGKIIPVLTVNPIE